MDEKRQKWPNHVENASGHEKRPEDPAVTEGDVATAHLGAPAGCQAWAAHYLTTNTKERGLLTPFHTAEDIGTEIQMLPKFMNLVSSRIRT